MSRNFADSCRGVFKIPDYKFDKTNYVESNEGDPELLLIIP